MSQDYNKTINLPKTKFSMRAGLSQTEPDRLKTWEEQNLYKSLTQRNKSKPLYVLHDGPPYANGGIHLGTAMNKTLKDFIVRYKNMSGFNAPFVPGWDTHGLPTELKARKKAGVENSTTIEDVKLRAICREFALNYLDEQREQFKRLGVIGDWDNPYITLTKDYEATQIETFADMACKGYIYRGLKPVYWCPECSTALAEAEIEYSEDPCDSMYVKFKVSDDRDILTSLGCEKDKTYFIIWTTTTWTLPGNVAICLGPEFLYGVVKSGDEFFIIAKELLNDTMKSAGIEDYEVIGELKGKDLEYIKTKHPFLERDSLVILGNHVTLESGTGCVHTAPGHGIEDFEACRNYPELEIVVPVDSSGRLTHEAGEMFKGLDTEEANKAIGEYIKNSGALFLSKKILHKYPHCWRCKKPVLFRATEQWFCSVEDFKDDAVKAIKNVRWIPSWGEDRITSMVKDRKDWCISRQRKWGVPIPIFFCKNCSEPLIDKNAMLKVADMFREEGSDSWFIKDADEILPEGISCKKCNHTKFYKEKDIMDVWFDSGVSHEAVLKSREYLSWPADMYLEGADQYRGWFQSSLLTSVATNGKAPYKSVISHGWVVDGEGKKMSKSLGNGIEPQEIVNKYGADILRLWVASSDYHADVRISDDILKQLTEAYRKIRNTARFILGNLYDFNPDNDMIPLDDCLDIDKLAITRLNELISKMTEAYENFEFYQAYHAVHNFCVVDMSNFYLDVIKDRLYVEKGDSKLRRAAQTVIYIILHSIVRLISPILCFTSDEIWEYIPHKKDDATDSVVLNSMPEVFNVSVDEDFINRWELIQLVREDVQKVLETYRKNKEIGKSLEAEVYLHCKDDIYDKLKAVERDLNAVFIVSKAEVVNDSEGKVKSENIEGLSITVVKSQDEKCERCWIHSKTVGNNKDHPTLCSRCAAVVNS